MIEIYLFVNPIGTECYQAERQILKLVADQPHKKIQFRFVPFVNMQTVDQLIQRYHLPKNHLHERNHIFQALYSAALDFKAVELQGKKKGQQFLLKLQETCGFKGLPYSEEVVTSFVKEVGADVEEFQKDRHSDWIKEAYFTDQQIARDMNVCQSPSCVVYNYSCEEDFGVLVAGALCKEIATLKNLCQSESEKIQQQRKNGICHDSYHKNATPKLHLL